MNQTILASGGGEFSQIYQSADLAALANAKNPQQLLVVVTAPYPTQELAYQTAKKYFENLGVIKNHKLLEYGELKTKVDALVQLFSSSSLQKRELIAHLEQWVSGFRHLEKGRNLDEIM